MTEVGRGTKVFAAAPVRGVGRPLGSPDDVIALMDDGAVGMVAVVADARARTANRRPETRSRWTAREPRVSSA